MAASKLSVLLQYYRIFANTTFRKICKIVIVANLIYASWAIFGNLAAFILGSLFQILTLLRPKPLNAGPFPISGISTYAVAALTRPRSFYPTLVSLQSSIMQFT